MSTLRKTGITIAIALLVLVIPTGITLLLFHTEAFGRLNGAGINVIWFISFLACCWIGIKLEKSLK